MIKIIQNIYYNNSYIELLHPIKQIETLSDLHYKKWYNKVNIDSKNDIQEFNKLIK